MFGQETDCYSSRLVAVVLLLVAVLLGRCSSEKLKVPLFDRRSVLYLNTHRSAMSNFRFDDIIF